MITLKLGTSETSLRQPLPIIFKEKVKLLMGRGFWNTSSILFLELGSSYTHIVYNNSLHCTFTFSDLFSKCYTSRRRSQGVFYFFEREEQIYFLFKIKCNIWKVPLRFVRFYPFSTAIILLWHIYLLASYVGNFTFISHVPMALKLSLYRNTSIRSA